MTLIVISIWMTFTLQKVYMQVNFREGLVLVIIAHFHVSKMVIS